VLIVILSFSGVRGYIAASAGGTNPLIEKFRNTDLMNFKGLKIQSGCYTDIVYMWAQKSSTLWKRRNGWAILAEIEVGGQGGVRKIVPWEKIRMQVVGQRDSSF
jgi:hypothetical protein